MMEDNLAFPFWTHVLGAELKVGKVDLNEGGEVVVVCTHGDSRQDVSVLDLPLPDPGISSGDWSSSSGEFQESQQLAVI